MTKLIGLTGGIATGKSTVANIFKGLGATIIDIDKIARKVVKLKTKPYQEIVDTFGGAILNPDQSINRPELARLIFKNKSLRDKLNKITHPAIIKEMKRRADLLSSSRVPIIVDAPLLFEVNLDTFFDKIIVVQCRKEAQIKRLRERDSLSAEEAEQRIASQLPLEAKTRRADFCIDNNSTLKDTEKQVKKIWYNFLISKNYLD